MEKQTFKLLIAATGSVAALKIPLLVKSVLDSSKVRHIDDSDRKFLVDFEVRVIVTEHAKHFFDTSELPASVQLFDDSSEWNSWSKRGDPVLHIELGKWADIMVIAPLDANTLAKMAQGICDNLLTCTTRAWDMCKPLLFCPAMNTRMWEHPVTSSQVAVLKSWGHEMVAPIKKQLVCGDTGVGAMAEVDDIVTLIHSKIRDLKL